MNEKAAGIFDDGDAAPSGGPCHGFIGIAFVHGAERGRKHRLWERPPRRICGGKRSELGASFFEERRNKKQENSIFHGRHGDKDPDSQRHSVRGRMERGYPVQGRGGGNENETVCEDFFFCGRGKSKENQGGEGNEHGV